MSICSTTFYNVIPWNLKALKDFNCWDLKDLLDKLVLPLDFVQDVMCLDLIKISDIIHVNTFIFYTIQWVSKLTPLYTYVGDEQDGGDA